MKRVLCLLFVFLLGALASCSNSNEDTITTTEKTEEVAYQIYSDLSYGEDERNVLDLYLPTNYDKDCIILFLHGGAWVSGDKSFYKDYMNTIASIGIACASMNYRYISKDVSCYDILDDITSATSYLKEYLNKDFNVALNQMALFGYSAGAHLSLLYGYKNRDISPISPKFVVSMAGPVDLTLDSFYNDNSLAYTLFSYMIDKRFDSETKDTVKEDLLNISPISYTDTAIPTLMVQGKKDTTVSPLNAEALDLRLTENSILHELVWMPNSDHLLQNDEEIFSTLYLKLYNLAQICFFGGNDGA